MISLSTITYLIAFKALDFDACLVCVKQSFHLGNEYELDFNPLRFMRCFFECSA